MTNRSTPEEPAIPSGQVGSTVQSLARLLRDGSKEGLPRQAFIILTLVSTVVIAILSLRVRLPLLSRELGLDEAVHNLAIFRAPTAWAMREAIRDHFQPFLEYLLRRLLWFPLFGHTEVGLRLPSLAASLLNIVAAQIVVSLVLRRFGRSRWEAWLLGCMAGLWCGWHTGDLGASILARHYAMTNLLSTLWVAFYLVGQPERRRWLFAALSLILLNTHFFTAALVGPAYLLLAVEDYRRGERKSCVAHVGIMSLLAVSTVAMNLPAFLYLVTNPVDPRSLTDTHALFDALATTMNRLERLVSFFQLPLLPTAMWLLLFLSAGYARLVDRFLLVRFVLPACVFVPGLLLAFSIRSNYPFSDRYLTPYFGFGPSLLALGYVSGRAMLFRGVASSPRKWLAFVEPALTTLVVALTMVMAISLAAQPGTLRLNRKPSDHATFISLLKRAKKPVLLLSSPCWASRVTQTYWEFIDQNPGAPLEIVKVPKYRECIVGGFAPGSTSENQIGEFIQKNPNGIVAFNQHHLPCPPLNFQLPFPHVRNSTATSCLTVIGGLNSVAQVHAAATELGYPAHLAELLRRN